MRNLVRLMDEPWQIWAILWSEAMVSNWYNHSADTITSPTDLPAFQVGLIILWLPLW